MKYERIPTDQIALLEKEFISFLALNGIDAPEWEKIKREDLAQSDTFLDNFSDMIWDASLAQMQFLRVNLEDAIILYQFMQEKAYLLHIDLSNIERTQPSAKWDVEDISLNWGDIEITQGEKSLDQNRNQDIYQLIQQGALTDDGGLYKALVVKIS